MDVLTMGITVFCCVAACGWFIMIIKDKEDTIQMLYRRQSESVREEMRLRDKIAELESELETHSWM